MEPFFTIRAATNPKDFQSYNTARLRDTFLIEDMFEQDLVKLTYSHYDRFIIGAVKPVTKSVTLESCPPLRAEFFLQRREMGVVNVGSKALLR